MSLELLKLIARDQQIFSIDDLSKKTQIKKDILKVILSRLVDRGFIETIEKGKYLIIPLGSEKGKYTLHEFVIGSYLVEPAAISYWSALNYFGLSEQIPNTVFIQTTSRKKKTFINVFGVDYQMVRIKPEKFFGFKKEWFEETPVTITDKEKTIIDCLDQPQYSGGVIEVVKAMSNKSLKFVTLNQYAIKFDNSNLIRRLGFLFDLLDFPHTLPLPKSNKYIPLDPTMPVIGNKIPKWRLVNNLGDSIKGDLE